ncbi:MAG: hypothetical protein ABW110_18760 [Steroidobacteraceae bacterium]
MNNEPDTLTAALKRLPVPEPRARFVDRALARAVAGNERRPEVDTRSFVFKWETWAGAALGGACAAIVVFLLMRPVADAPPATPVLALALHETRDIDVLIDSERELRDATIHIVASGSIVLAGLDNERTIEWETDLDRGSNLLTLPVAARSMGKGQLVAWIEHDGRMRRVAIDITVRPDPARS